MKLAAYPSLFLLLFLLPAASAQTYVGINGGGGMPDEVLFRGALAGEFHLSENVSLLVEAAYIQRENPSLLAQLPRGRNYIQPVINYLEAPVMIKLKLPLPIVSLYALAGPQLAYGLRLSSTYEEDNMIFTERLDFGRAAASRLDIGCYFGAGMEKEIAQGRKIFLDVRYYLGLYNINTEGEEEVFNQGKAFALGFLIPVRRDEKNRRTSTGR